MFSYHKLSLRPNPYNAFTSQVVLLIEQKTLPEKTKPQKRGALLCFLFYFMHRPQLDIISSLGILQRINKWKRKATEEMTREYRPKEILRWPPNPQHFKISWVLTQYSIAFMHSWWINPRSTSLSISRIYSSISLVSRAICAKLLSFIFLTLQIFINQ